MPEGNPLVAAPKSDTTAVTGIGIAESSVDLANGISNGDWVEAGLGAVGVGLEVLSMVIDPIGTVASYGVSWLIEHVKPLKDALDWFAGDPPVIRSFSETWANVAAEVGKVSQDLGSELKTGTAGWTGQAADAYRGDAAQTADAVAGAGKLADGISAGVMIMGEVVAAVRELVRDLVAEVVGKVITWALEAVATLGLGTPVIVAQAVSAISKVVKKISDLVRKLVKTIGNVTPRIRKIIDKLDEIISKLGKLGRKADGTTPNHVSSPDTPSHTTSPSSSTSPSSTSPSTHTPDTPSTKAPDGPDSPTSPDATSQSPGSTRNGKPDTNNNLRKDAENPRDRSQPPEGRCEGREPIDLASGEMYMTQVDVDLPGVLPLVIGRAYVSSYRSGRLFGPSWASTLDQRIEVDSRGVCFADPDGVILVYPTPPSTGEPVLPVEGARWPLARVADGYVITQPNTGRTLHFGQSAVTAITDRNGNRIDFHYTEGELSRITHSGGYDIAVQVDNGRVTELGLSNSDGTSIPLVRYRYDLAARLAEVINSSGRALRFDYDFAGRITRWTDRNGEWYGYTYDERGRCVRTEGSGDVFAGTIEYDRLVTRETNSLGHVTHHYFNESRQLVRRTDAMGNETRFEWDRYDRLLSKTDPLGRKTSYIRDADGNILAMTRPDGTLLTAEYNGLGLPVRQVDPDNAAWRKEYDANGNLTALVDPAGATTRYEYHPNGSLATITDAVGNTQRLTVNAAGLIVAATDGSNATTHYERDQFGRVTRIVDPAGGATTQSWTIEGKLIARTLPDGSTERWRYDAEGNEIEHVDGAGHVTRTTTTHFDLPATRVAPDGSTLTFNYDTELRLQAVTNAHGLVWRYEYDAAGNLVRETDYDGRQQTYVLDAAGQVAQRIDNTGHSTVFERDVLGQVVSRTTATGVTRFTYDPAGRVLSANNGHAETVFQRDVRGRVVAETTNGKTISSQYDLVGRRVKRRTPTGVESEWTYDAAHRPVALRSGDRTISFGYDIAGREVERRVDAGPILAQKWDANHRLLGQTLSTATKPIQHRSYRYRPDGHLQSIEDSVTGPKWYDLDPVGRPVVVRSQQWTEQYQYDATGNLTASNDEFRTREYHGTLLQRDSKTRYGYDERGRLVLRQRQNQSWHFGWDAEDRLSGVTTPDGVRWRYVYDALGRRMAKQRLNADGSVAEQTDFSWDGTTLVEQVHSSGRATMWEHAGAQPLAQRERVAGHQEWVDQQFYAIVTDLVGAPSELVGSDGEVAWRAGSTLWGAATRGGTPLRFPGQYFDEESGLHYNYMRHYDPENARYVSDDPLGIVPALNQRTYVYNPTRFIDPLGLTPAPGGAHGPGTGNHTNPPPPQVQGPISMDDAVDLGARHVGGNGRVIESGSGGYQFVSTSTDAAGNRVASVARFDINMNSPHVQQYGPHLNLETQVNGRPVRSGPYADPHIPIDPSTIRPGDIPPP